LGVPATAAYNSSFTLTPGGGSGTAALIVGATGVCSLAINQVTMTSGTGTCAVTVDRAGDANYNAATQVSVSASATKIAQAALTLSGVPATAAYNSSFTVTPGGGSGTAALVVGTTGVCSLAINQVTMTSGTGTCAVTVDRAGDANYNAATQVSVSANATKIAQAALSIASPTAGTFGQFYTMTATGGTTAGATTFAVVAGSTACAIPSTGIHAGQLEITSGTGTCSITATMAGNSNYTAVTSASQAVTVGKATATVTLSNLTHTFNGSAKSATAMTTPAGLNVVTLVYKQGVTTVAAPTQAGAYSVEATLSNMNYELAAASNPTTGTLTINKAAGSVTVSNIPSAAIFGGSFVPTYTILGDGTTSVASLTSATCAVSAGTVYFNSIGTCTIQASVAEGTNYLAATGVNQSFTIATAPTIVSVTTTPASVQYSDKVDLVATVSPAILAAVAPATGVTFKIDTRTVGSATLALDGTLLKGTLSNVVVTEGPGAHTVTAEFTGKSSNFVVANPTTGLTVTQENAAATYIGADLVSTPSISTSTALVTLRATIQDATALQVGDPLYALYDASAGDIRNATVKFLDLDTVGTPTLCTATLVLVNAADLKTAIASCDKTFDIGSFDSKQFTIGIVVEGYYARSSTDDAEVITVSKPLTGFITGGGYIVNKAMGGTYAGTLGLKTNFGFNVKVNKSGSNLQGGVNIIIRRGGHVYQIKSNAISSMSSTPTPLNNDPLVKPGIGQFTGKANLQDITNPNSSVSLGGNMSLQMAITDKGEPGANDLVGFTLYDPSGALFFSSNWDGVQTADQQLNQGNGGGNVQVR
jgi:hypothetical protein